MTTIDYYLTNVSPWSYLGHDAFVGLARRHGAAVNYKPMRINAVFEATGGLPLPRRAPARQRYRLCELQRWREARDLPLNLHPAHFPTDPSLVDRSTIALVSDGADPAGFVAGAFRAVWVEERDIADRSVVAALLADAGHDAGATLERAESDKVAAVYEANTRDAIAADVFGAPTYVLNGEPFWGQDRLELVERALASGRQPYRP